MKMPAPGAPRVRRSLGAPTPGEVRRVKELLREGRSYATTDKLMGWPDAHGGRSWYIENVPKAYAAHRKQPAPRRRARVATKRRGARSRR
jgi:hypothetical protein